MQIAIVDDDMEFSGWAEGVIQNFFKEMNEPVLMKRYCESSTLLSEVAVKGNYDIYFLDVELPDISGLELAQRIKNIETDAVIVFISAYEKYAVSSYKIRADYYVMKEEYKEEIPVILKRIWQKRQDKERDYYVIQNASYGKKMRLDHIMYLMREKKYVVIYCADGNKYRERGTLMDMYCKLPHGRFVYIDRGCIINLKCVSEWKGDVIGLQNGDKLIASRRMSTAFRDALARYWRGEC